MPNVLHLKSPDWELTVWVKDAGDRLGVLKKTLLARGGALAASSLHFSPPVAAFVYIEPAPDGMAQFPVARLDLPQPLFFENKQYEFEFVFQKTLDASCEPVVVHRLAAIEDAFHFSPKPKSLRGSINFGNDVGWFRLGLRYALADGLPGAACTQMISLEVLPTKMDMDTDLRAIHGVIDAAYPLWRFSFAQRTELELQRSNQAGERFALLWLAHFKQLRDKLESGVQQVLRAPHTRLLSDQRMLRLDKLRGRLTPRLEQHVQAHMSAGELHHRYRVDSRRLSVDTPENRFVKMVLKQCSYALVQIIKLATQYQKSPENSGRLSNSFFDALTSWKTPLDQLANHPVLREVGAFAGQEGESLVLHQRAGYANVYRIWQALKQYLGIFGDQASVSMKSVAQLYEVWCFLEIKSMLEELGFEEQSSIKAGLNDLGFEKLMVNGTSSAFNLFRGTDGLRIRLSHEPSFNANGKPEIGKIRSWTTAQRPDIFLEATFSNGETLRWIFDAKYRVVDADGVDAAPDDAINQMHRYRDALIQIDKAGEGWRDKSRPVLGAFVLYPGWFDEAKVINPYDEAIRDVGIGAFPMLPERPNTWLREFLRAQFKPPLGKLTFEQRYPPVAPDRYFVEDSVRIPTTGVFASRYHDLAMVAHLAPVAGRDKSYLQKFKDGKALWYHIPVSTTLDRSIAHNVMQETRYCAIAAPVAGERLKIIEYIYDVVAVSIVKRCDMTVEQAGKLSGDTSAYWLLRLGAARVLPLPIEVNNVRKFVVFHATATELFASKKWDDLQQRYAALV